MDGTMQRVFMIGGAVGMIRELTRRMLLGALALLLGVPVVSGDEPLPVEPVLPAIESMVLRDSANRERQLGRLVAGRKVIVLASLGVECPLARLYMPRLVELAKQHAGEDFVFVGFGSNHQDDLTDLAALAREFEIPFVLLRDHDARLADRLGVTRTPEIVVLDGSGRMRYRGRIDDQYLIGARRASATATPVEDAIAAIRKGEEVAVPVTEPIGCLIGRRPEPRADAHVTYTGEIARIMNAHCVECHRPGQIGPFSLTEYDDVAAWAPMLQETMHAGRMPPWLADPAHGKFSNDPRLSAADQRLFDAWVAAGCPEGDPADLPELPEFVEGWRIAQPDVVVEMAEKPFSVPAEGVVDYQYFVVDPGFTEDKYLVAAEPQPGNPAVVHHIIVHVIRPGGDRIDGVGIAIAYAPGMPPLSMPTGHAMKIPAGSRLVFEMHYTPNGVAAEDLSRVGLRFAPRDSVRQLVISGSILNRRFEIPPGAEAHRVTASRGVDRDYWVTSLTPHMHFRGAAFRYEVIYPDGSREILLNVPRYDFNWQLRYEFARPKKIPAGSRVVCEAVFDNSAGNPANPDPKATVRWGEQSWEEMMIGFYTVVPGPPPVEAARPDGESTVARGEG